MILICEECRTKFNKSDKEIRRQRKKNPERKFFCSLSCSCTYTNKNTPAHNSTPPPGRTTDQYSPFRYFMRKARNRKHEYDIDLPYLKTLWEEQDGRCAISGIKMALPPSGRAWERLGNDPYKPSLDRIDSSKGYFKGNVQFVCNMANLCKSNWTDQQVIEFCVLTTQHNQRNNKCQL